MLNLDYQKIARILSKSEPQSYRLLENGGMVVITADSRRLSFTPAEVREADLPIVKPDKPKADPRPVQDVIVAPKPPVAIPAPREQVPTVMATSQKPRAKKP